MAEQLRLIVLTSCTGEKVSSPEDRLTAAEFESIRDPAKFTQYEARLAQYRTPAEQMYTGQQHVRLMEGVKAFRNTFGRDSLDLQIVSAGYGIVEGDRQIVPYEITFQGMNTRQIHSWAEHLRIPEMAHRLFSEPADLMIVSLGDSYLRALALDDTVTFASPTLFFTSTQSQKFVPQADGWPRIVPLDNHEASRFACALVGLKGDLVRRILLQLSQSPNFLQKLRDADDILALLDQPHLAHPTTARKLAEH